MKDLGLLLLRVGAGGMLAFGHGLGKVSSVLAGRFEFADPLGIGSAPSLVLAALAEFVCSLLVVVGFKTRYSAMPPAFTMLVAAFVVHWDDPWGRKEHALLFFVLFATLVVAGPGRYALDSLLRGGRKRRKRRS